MGWNESIKKELKYCGSEVLIGECVFFTNPSGVVLNDRVRIDPFSLITTGLEVGSNVQICSHTVLGGGAKHTIYLGDWTFIGYGSKLFCGSECYSGEYGPVNDFWGNNRVFHGDIRFNNYSGVASDVIVMPGIELPEGCKIAAKSFVYSSRLLKPWYVMMNKYSWKFWEGPKLKPYKRVNKGATEFFANQPEFLKYHKD